MSSVIDGTTTIVCSSWLNDSISCQSETSFFCSSSNCEAACSAERPGGSPINLGSVVVTAGMNATEWVKEEVRGERKDQALSGPLHRTSRRRNRHPPPAGKL